MSSLVSKAKIEESQNARDRERLASGLNVSVVDSRVSRSQLRSTARGAPAVLPTKFSWCTARKVAQTSCTLESLIHRRAPKFVKVSDGA